MRSVQMRRTGIRAWFTLPFSGLEMVGELSCVFDQKRLGH